MMVAVQEAVNVVNMVNVAEHAMSHAPPKPGWLPVPSRSSGAVGSANLTTVGRPDTITLF